jgi:hypothetical protein
MEVKFIKWWKYWSVWRVIIAGLVAMGGSLAATLILQNSWCLIPVVVFCGIGGFFIRKYFPIAAKEIIEKEIFEKDIFND